VEEQVGRRLGTRDVLGAEQPALEARQQAGEAEGQAHLVGRSVGRDAVRDGDLRERVLDAGD
jgi:hypothetical protein